MELDNKSTRTNTKVLHVVNLQSFGGIQKLVIEIANQSATNGFFSVDIFSIKGIGNLHSNIHPKVNLIKSKAKGVFGTINHSKKVFRDYDIIHFHGPYTLHQIAAVLAKRKIIYTEHGTLQKANIKFTIKHFFQKIIFGKLYLEVFSKSVIFVSNWLKEDLNLKRPKQYVLHNGMLYQEPKIIENESFTLSIAARLIKKKRVDFGIDVLKILKAHPNIKLNIIGDGPELPYLKDYAGELLNKTVFFLGYRKDAYDLIASSDIYLMTTYKEPFGLVLLEAMMSETLILATKDCGGATEIIGEQFPELLVSNEVEMSDKVIYWMKEKDHKKELELKLKSVYKDNFTIEKMVNKLELIYKDSINSR